MRDRIRKLPFLCLAVLLALPFKGCMNDGGTEIPNEIRGSLVLQSGAPAAYVTVTLYPVNFAPAPGGAKRAALTSKLSVQADAKGRFVFPAVPDGEYNVIAGGEDLYAFRDSIVMHEGLSVKLARDTLRAPGSVTGVIRLQPQHDPRTATVQVIGTGFYANVSQEGRFTLTGLPRGNYLLRVEVSLPLYTPLYKGITIASAKNDTLPEALVPFYSGIPAITGLTAAAPAAGKVALRWNRPDYAPVRVYQIYRNKAGSLAPDTLIGSTSDTSFIDTVFSTVYGSAPRAGQATFYDTVPRAFDYRVRVRNLSDETGPFFHTASASVQPPALAMRSGRWHRATANAPFAPVANAAAVAFKDSLWLIGGTVSNGPGEWKSSYEVWKSGDGITWQMAVNASTLGTLNDMRAVVFHDSLWIMGVRYTDYRNVIWKSGNGSQWIQAAAPVMLANATNSLLGAAFLPFKNQLWAGGGLFTGTGTGAGGGAFRGYLSSNGTSWTETLYSLSSYGGVESRFAFGMEAFFSNKTVFNDKLWMVSGGAVQTRPNNKLPVWNPSIWNSDDGISWTEAVVNAPFLPRDGHSLTTHAGKLWITGGNAKFLASSSWLCGYCFMGQYGGTGVPTSEAWSSSDGLNWEPVDLYAPFPARGGHATVSFHGKLWVIGGGAARVQGKEVEEFFNDVWYYE